MKVLETACLVLAMLLFGSYNTVICKLQYQTLCPTLPSGIHPFNKPWLTNLMMFAGEASMLIPFTMRVAARRHRHPGLDEALLSPRKVPLHIFAIPAVCDVVGSGVAAVAMMLIDAAVWQMMRGAVIIFSAIMAVTFLRRRLQAYHWIGVLLTMIGLFLIGTAAVLAEAKTSPKADASHARLGIALVILAQIFSAFQFTFEEYLLTGYSVSSLQTVGMEGLWGCLYMAVVLAVMSAVPGSDHGVYESFPDGVYMIQGSHIMQFLVFSYMLSIATYNYLGMQLCRKLSAVTRCLVDCMRTVVVWVSQLAMYYLVSKDYGQPWTEYSYLQVLGFACLVLGTFIYNGVVRLPAMDYRRLDLDMPQKVLQATWSPTVNRASAFGWGPKFGPQSPHAPNSPHLSSPLPAPFGSPLCNTGEDDDALEGEVVLEIEDGDDHSCSRSPVPPSPARVGAGGGGGGGK